MTTTTITDRQADVLRVLAEATDSRGLRPSRGLRASQVRDAIYPDDSPMRRKRTAGRGASGFNGSVGSLGNLAAGRILSALFDKRLAWQDSVDERWTITEAGRRALAEHDA